MKADRLVSLLLMLQSAERHTAHQLARALEVSDRTIYRDIDALSAAGIPVYAERGADGGIALADGYRKALMHLGEEDVRALFVSTSPILADLGLASGLDRALQKLHGGLSDAQRSAAEKARGRIHIDQRRWNQSDAPVEKLAVLRRAVWDDRRVELTYEDRHRTRSKRVLDPFGLVSKAGVWYLIARTDGGFRSFRADRIVEAVELAERFARPDDFDLNEHWQKISSDLRMSQAREYAVTLRVDPDWIQMLNESYWPVEVRDPAEPTILRVLFPEERVAVWQVISWGENVEVLEPQSLCATICAKAAALVERYSAFATR